MKTNLSKKEIRYNLETVLIHEIEKMEGTESSKKLKRAVKKVSKRIAPKVMFDMKKKRRKETRGVDVKPGHDLNGYLVDAGGEKTENGHV